MLNILSFLHLNFFYTVYSFTVYTTFYHYILLYKLNRKLQIQNLCMLYVNITEGPCLQDGMVIYYLRHLGLQFPPKKFCFLFSSSPSGALLVFIDALLKPKIARRWPL